MQRQPRQEKLEAQHPVFKPMLSNLDQNLGSRRSAKVVVPLVLDWLRPRSVIDVGCGVGSWLAVFAELGVHDLLGVDIDYMDRRLLVIPAEQYLGYDLNQPLKIPRQFDLVLCLEVAGYFPEQRSGILIDSLTGLGPAVLFSAPIPHQGDPRNHQLNLQWPEYWVDLFARRGYSLVDCLRKRIWNHSEVQWWFAQNTLLFVRQDCLETNPALLHEREATTGQLSLVHPALFEDKLAFSNLLRALPAAFKKALKRRGLRTKTD